MFFSRVTPFETSLPKLESRVTGNNDLVKRVQELEIKFTNTCLQKQ